MDPVPHKITAVSTATLRSFILMMRKDQIPATTMDIDALTQMRSDHRRTFQMPTRPPSTPGTVPTRFLGRGRLPKDKIPWMTLVIRNLDARTSQHIVQISAT